MNNSVALSQPETENRRKRRSQTVRSLLLAMKHKNNLLRKKSNLITNSYRILHKHKSRLTDIIATVEDYRRRVSLRNYLFKKRVTPLNQTVEEVDTIEMMVKNRISEEDEGRIESARVLIRDATTLVHRTEGSLKTTKRTIVSKTDDSATSSKAPVALSIRTEIVNVDPFVVLRQNGGVKLYDFKKCYSCEKNDMDCIFYPCGHQCACLICANKCLKQKETCPACNQLPSQVVKVYFV